MGYIYQNNSTFLVQINVTRDCNLRCTHCYIHSDKKRLSSIMSECDAIRLAKDIRNYIGAKGKRIEIHFVGGEPTIVGIEWFRKVVPEFRTVLAETNYTISLISNILVDNIIEFATLFDNVVTSWEPDTRFVSNKGIFKKSLLNKWEKSVNALLSNGVNLGVTTTITRQTCNIGAHRILDYFYDLGLKQVHFGFFIPEGDGLKNIYSVMPRHHETSEFLIQSANWAIPIRNRDPEVWVNPFESLLLSIHRGITSDDIVCPILSGSIDIDYNGDACSCLERLGGVGNIASGNVFKDGLQKVCESKPFMAEIISAKKFPNICIGCDEYEICKGGCGVLSKYTSEIDNDCHGFKRFILYVKDLYFSGVAPKGTESKVQFAC